MGQAGKRRARAVAAIPSLTGVRATAALWVVLHHLRLGPLRLLDVPAVVDRACRLGYLGVDLFGFLSGFVIAHNYAERLARDRRTGLAPYLWARGVRIAPLHWLVLALLVAAVAFVPGFPARPAERPLYRASELPLQALLLHGWSLGNGFAWNLPSWTVSSEWLCYLVFPLVAPLVARERDAARAALLAALAFVATALALRALGHPDWNAAMQGGVVRIAGEFAAGCLLQRAFAAGFARGAAWGAIALGAVVAAALAVAADQPTALVACLGVLVLALAQQQGVVARAFSTRTMVALGDASYAVYITHWLSLGLLALWLPPALATPRTSSAGAISLGVHLAAIFGFALVLHHVFENPVRRRLRRWFRAER